jgi:Ca2+-binding EF-hand superfamily protein
VFDGFDVDKNGTIERDELNAALKSLTQGQVTDEEISSIFDESDFDHGTLPHTWAHG